MAQESSEIFYDFDLIIRKSGSGSYIVSMVADTGVKRAEETFQHFDSLTKVPKALAKVDTSDPRDVPSMYEKLKNFGQKLYEAAALDGAGRQKGLLHGV